MQGSSKSNFASHVVQLMVDQFENGQSTISGNMDCYQNVSSIWHRLDDGNKEHILDLPSPNGLGRVKYRITWNKDGSLSTAYHDSAIDTVMTNLSDWLTAKTGGENQSDLKRLQTHLDAELAIRIKTLSNPDKSFLGSWTYYHQNLSKHTHKVFEAALPLLLQGQLPDDPDNLSLLATLLLKDDRVQALLPVDAKPKELVQAILQKLDKYSFQVEFLVESALLLEILQANTSLQHLTLQWKFFAKNEKDDGDVKALAQLIRTNKTITSLSLVIDTKVHSQNLDSRFQRLMDALKDNKQIVFLTLENWCLSDEKSNQSLAEYVQSNPKLEHLNLPQVTLTHSEAGALGNSLKNLKQLSLGYLSGAGAEKLLSILPKEKYFYYGVLDNAGEKLLTAALNENKTLKKLTLIKPFNEDRNLMSTEGLRSLLENVANHPTLEVFVLTGCTLSGLADEVEKIMLNGKKLSQLSLEDCLLDEAIIAAMGNALTNHRTLKRLSLNVTQPSNNGWTKLAQGLQKNTTLKEFNLNPHWSNGPLALDQDALQALTEMLDNNSTLQSLGSANLPYPQLAYPLRRNMLWNDPVEFQTRYPNQFANLLEIACCVGKDFPTELQKELTHTIIAQTVMRNYMTLERLQNHLRGVYPTELKNPVSGTP